MAILKQYQCHKQVHAYQCNRQAYNDMRGWTVPADENPSDDGYVVIYNMDTDREHVSWSPADVFNEGYTEIKE